MVTLKDVHTVLKKNYHIENFDLIDLVCAIMISNRLPGIPLWLIIVGHSGSNKSGIITPFISNPNTYAIHNLTARTLVNGQRSKKKAPDLAPKLDGKIVLIPDMAQIMTLKSDEKAQIWAQLRDLYDGFAGKESGSGGSAKYSGLKVTLIGASTNAIDSQILIHQSLGTRELYFRPTPNQDINGLMDKVLDNEDKEAEVKQEVETVCSQFIEDIGEPLRKEPPQHIIDKLKEIALWIRKMRASADFGYNHELRNLIQPEEPTRILKQLKRVYVCLKALGEDYKDEDALRILKQLARSCASPLRLRILDHLIETMLAQTTTKISDSLHLGKATVKRELLVLHALGIIERLPDYDEHENLRREEWRYNRSRGFKMPV